MIKEPNSSRNISHADESERKSAMEHVHYTMLPALYVPAASRMDANTDLSSGRSGSISSSSYARNC